MYSARLVCDVGVEEIERLLRERKKAGAVTRQSYIRAISAFYGWCVRRGFRLDNPLSKLRKKLPKADVTILSIPDTQKLLNAANEEELPVLVLALFSGIRIAEFRKITRDTRGEEHDTCLDWKNVDLKAKQVFIPPNLDKNQHGRYVDIPANALVWLKECRNLTGAVIPDNWRNHRQALEQRSGVNLPQNVLRHSFCSYRIALDQDYSKAAAIVGNSPAMLRKHYVQVLPKKEGREYFLIKPEKKGEKKILQFAAAS
jgi:integrase